MARSLRFALWAVLSLPAYLSGGQGADLLDAIHRAGLDASECYRVRDISFARDEARIFLTDGYLIFGGPVNGRRLTAVFTSDVEGGDAELLLLPPNRAERTSLAQHTGTPNLEEHFTSAIFVFADNTEEEIMEQIRANPYIKKAPEMGALLTEKWSAVARNLDSSFGLRLAMDLLGPHTARPGFFGSAFSGKQLGAFDLIDEPRVREPIVAGQGATNGFEVWTSFVPRSMRTRTFAPEYRLSNYRIDSTIDSDLKLHCITRVNLKINGDREAALPFEISGQLHVTSASIDGEPVELLTNPAPRSSLVSPAGNDLFVLVPAKPLLADRTYEVELHYEGTVIADAGNQVYFVASRGSWFPSRDLQFATFDLKFHYPKGLDLVASGDPVDEHLEGDQKVTHRVASTPIRLAGFNLGIYERATVKRPGLTIDICANRNLERALQARPVPAPFVPAVTLPVRRTNQAPVTLPSPPPPPNPADRLRELAADLGDIMDFYSARFGPAPIKTLEVAPVPGRFGQGFPGLIYLSTYTYVQPASLDQKQTLFFTEMLHAHEAAHQWWGNVVTSAGYHDDWIMESLANYSALMYVEKKKGPKELDSILQTYRVDLLAKPASRNAEAGATVESSGPIVQGTRIDGGWNAIVYGKGSWIIHMLRKKMGDEAFQKMLPALLKKYQARTLSADEFRAFCAGFLPPKSPDPKLEGFFDQWVYGTGIPALKIDYKITGKAPLWRVTGSVTQTGVSDDFTSDVPVEIQMGRLKPLTVMVRASSDPAPFSVTTKAQPTKALIDTRAILSR